MYDLIAFVLAGALIYWAFTFSRRRHRRWQKKLLDRGVKVQGYVHFVKQPWIQIMSAKRGRIFELYAWFEYNGKTYQVMEKRRIKPRYKAGDPVTICFDPENPRIHMIMDFTEETEML